MITNASFEVTIFPNIPSFVLIEIVVTILASISTPIPTRITETNRQKFCKKCNSGLIRPNFPATSLQPRKRLYNLTCRVIERADHTGDDDDGRFSLGKTGNVETYV